MVYPAPVQPGAKFRLPALRLLSKLVCSDLDFLFARRQLVLQCNQGGPY